MATSAKDGWQVDGVYKAFDNLSILFGGSLLCWMGSYLTGRTQRVKLEDYLSESIQCHCGVSQGSHLGPIFLILDINGALDIFENVSLLRYAEDLKDLFMTSWGSPAVLKGSRPFGRVVPQ
jgi:hypothetical protein